MLTFISKKKKKKAFKKSPFPHHSHIMSAINYIKLKYFLVVKDIFSLEIMLASCWPIFSSLVVKLVQTCPWLRTGWWYMKGVPCPNDIVLLSAVSSLYKGIKRFTFGTALCDGIAVIGLDFSNNNYVKNRRYVENY